MKYPQLVSMPTEVTDWLEVQLEERGIDAVVYTRYILSLLYGEPEDVSYLENDLHTTQSNKEVRRSASGRKRFRCFSDWRHYAHADAEQLKRAAAIECLMSASDQKWEIAPLVDELREKLRKCKSNIATETAEVIPTEDNCIESKTLSSEDLANQYYTAFPSLVPESQHKFGDFIPKYYTYPRHYYKDTWNLLFSINTARNRAKMSANNTEQLVPEQNDPFGSNVSISTFFSLDVLEALDISEQNVLEVAPTKDEIDEISDEDQRIKSIWSNDVVDKSNMYDKAVGYGRFENLRRIWDHPTLIEVEPKSPDCSNDFLFDDSYEVNKAEQWSSDVDYADEDDNKLEALVEKSLLLLSHDEKESAFVKVPPKFFQSNLFYKKQTSHNSIYDGSNYKFPTEDLFFSKRTHFRPIGTQRPLTEDEEEVRYPDGATFQRSGNTSKSDKSKSLCVLEIVQNHSKDVKMSDGMELEALNFDTDYDLDMEVDFYRRRVPYKRRVARKLEASFPDENKSKGARKCTCEKNINMATKKDFSTGNDSKHCVVHLEASEKLAKIWNTDLSKLKSEGLAMKLPECDSIWKFDPVQNDKNVEQASNCASPNSDCNMDDGAEQLFLDLLTFQKTFAENLDGSHVSLDISELCTSRKDCKNCYSADLVDDSGYSWSLATQVEHRRMAHMSSVPVLHSVTL